MHAALIPSLAILLVTAVFAPAPASGAGLTLRGSVVHADGLPAARARVDIATAKPRHGLGILCPSCYADCRKSTFTDQEGSFQFAELDPSLTFRLLVTKPGSLALYSHSLDPLENNTPGGGVPLFLAAAPTDVPPERLVRGRLVDATGRPIAGGLVSAEAECTVDRTSYGRGVTTPVVSDDEGRFELIAPEPIVRVSLEVFAEGYAGMLSDELAPGALKSVVVITRSCGGLLREKRAYCSSEGRCSKRATPSALVTGGTSATKCRPHGWSIWTTANRRPGIGTPSRSIRTETEAPLGTRSVWSLPPGVSFSSGSSEWL
ncbi:MAG: carboxypeptidase-like regulatory domain-containing protein, partial [Planctomycetota bacterium]